MIRSRGHCNTMCTASTMAVVAEALGTTIPAVWGAGQVRCYTPGGEFTAVVTVPARHTSSVAFIGPDLDRLLITTAAGDEPEGGRLFVADVGVRGLPLPPWRPADT